jgi:iron complex outermembrane receptor protein
MSVSKCLSFARFSLGSVCVPALAAFVAVGDVRAQDTTASMALEEVVVTATRREERLQDVPLAVSALSAEQLASTGFKELADIQYALPGVYVGTTPNDAGFRLRGVGTAGGFSSSSEQNVGTVVDGVVIPIGNPLLSLGDVERVEVLKGPQGTQFGKNASSGVVSITTRAPNLDEVEGSVFASYGELNERDIHGSISVPFGGGKAATSLYLFDKAYDGFIENRVRNEEWGGTHSSGARGKLLVQPSDDLSIAFNADYARTKLDGPDQLWTLNRLPNNPAPPFGPDDDFHLRPGQLNPGAFGVTPGFDNEESLEEYDSERDIQNYGASLEFNFGIGDGTITSITAYRVTKSDPYTFAIDGTPTPKFRVQNYGGESNFTSQEIRWTSPSGGAFEYVAGVYLSRQRTGLGDGQSAQLRPILNLNPALQVSVSRGIGSASTTSESMAAFLDGSLGLTDTLRLIAGARYTADDVDAEASSRIDPAFPPGPGPNGLVGAYTALAKLTGSTSDENVSGRLGLEWKPNDDVLLYATAARGYLGPTVTYSVQSFTRTDVESQTVDDITVGFKTQFLDRRLTFNGNVFYDKYKNLQTSVFDSALSEFLTENAGGLETQGLELELAVAATDSLRLSLGYTYADAQFTDYVTACPNSIRIQGPAAIAAACNAPGGTALYQAEGDMLPGSPKHTVTAGIGYLQPIGASMAFDANLNAYHRSETWNSAGDELTIHPSYELVNVGFGFGDIDRAWRVGVFARNVFDERFHAGLLSLPFAGTGGVMNWNTRDGRRTVGVSAEARF